MNATTTLKYGEQGFSFLHALYAALLAEADRFCRALELEYVLLYQGLWGANTLRAFLPGATRLSIALLREDYERLLTALAGEKRHRRFRLELPGGEGERSHARLSCEMTRFAPRPKGDGASVPPEAVGLDIFPLDRTQPDPLRQARRLRRILAWNAALERRSGRWAPGADPARAAGAELEIRIKSLFPRSWIMRRLERLMRGRAQDSAERLAVYLPEPEAEAVTYFERQQLFPCAAILLGKHHYLCPGKPHEVLSALYGDYRAILSDDASESEDFDCFEIDAAHWADVLYADDPAVVL